MNDNARKEKKNEEKYELGAEDRSSAVRRSNLADRCRPRRPRTMSDWLGPIGILIRHRSHFWSFFGDTKMVKVLVTLVGS